MHGDRDLAIIGDNNAIDLRVGDRNLVGARKRWLVIEKWCDCDRELVARAHAVRALVLRHGKPGPIDKRLLGYVCMAPMIIFLWNGKFHYVFAAVERDNIGWLMRYLRVNVVMRHSKLKRCKMTIHFL